MSRRLRRLFDLLNQAEQEASMLRAQINLILGAMDSSTSGLFLEISRMEEDEDITPTSPSSLLEVITCDPTRH